ncbi:MAG: histidinol-phosphate transaminase [Armatimonadota bacterium]|nr:histidinol-phosphate transaminase [Armatimonadota bacterium]MDW8026538.1 histidinol-phosphate transaminase [Armatimonadota bacterium]
MAQMAIWDERVRKCVQRLKPYIPGKPIEEVQRELGLSDVIKLASNENPLGPSPKAVEAAMRALSHVHLYPDDSCYRLKKAIAEHYCMPEDCILIGRGSDEILLHAALAFIEPGDEVIYAHPSFVMYSFVSTLMDAKEHVVPLKDFTHDLDAMAECVTERTKLIFISNPNNPTGTIVKEPNVRCFVESLPNGVLVIFDEAYREYVDDEAFPNTLDYVRDGLSVLTLRTFSKAYGLAGLRIGYGFAPPCIAELISRVREPFNVSSIAQAAAEAALQDKEHVERSRELVIEGKNMLYRAFDELGLKYVPTQANFIFVDLGIDSREAFNQLLRCGIIIRTGEIFGMPTWARITIGKPEENERLVEALKKILLCR